MSRLETVWAVIASSFFLGLAAVAIFLWSGPWVDAQARKEADAWCRSIQIGESVVSMRTKAEAGKVHLAIFDPEEGKTRYQAWFSGFLANGFTCDIYAENNIVSSKFRDDHTW